MPNIAIQPGTAPVDAPFPPTSAQALLNFVAAYLGVQGLETLTGVIISATEPAAADRDKVWVKNDAVSDRALGFYVYAGGWQQVPFIIPQGDTEPAGAKKGELFYNTKLNALRMFDGTSWTTNLWPSGTTASRPSDVGSGYLYFDTDIGKLLRKTAQGWSTFEGGVGDIKMVDFADEAAATEANPGWSVFEPLRGRFPIGANGDNLVPQQEGGTTLDEMQLTWSAKRRSASGGTREASATFIAELTLNGVAKTADGTKADGLSDIGSESTINLKPPFKALIFLRKDF